MTLFIVLHLVLCCFLVLVILLQPGKGDAGIGFGSSSQSIFGSKGAGNFLTKTTSAVAFLFLATSFGLTYKRLSDANSSVMNADTAVDPAAAKAPEPTKEETKPAEAPKK